MKKEIKITILLTLVISCAMLLTGCVSIIKGLADYIDPENLYDEGNYEGVIAMIDVDEEIAHDNYVDILLLIKSHMVLDNPERALEIVDQYVQQHTQFKIERIKVEIYKNMFEEALMEEAAKAILKKFETRFDDFDLMDKMNYGYLLIAVDRNDEAIELYLTLLEGDIDDENLDVIYNNLAWSYANISDFESAINYSELSLGIVPNDTISLTNLGNAYMGLDQYEKAKEIYLQAIQSDNDNNYAYYGLGIVNENLENSDKALEAWLEHTRILDADIDGWYGIYRNCEDAGRRELLKDSLEKIVELNPSSYYYSIELMEIYEDEKDLGRLSNVVLNYYHSTSEYQRDILLADFDLTRGREEEGLKKYKEILENYDLDYYDYYDIFYELIWQEQENLIPVIVEAVDNKLGILVRLELEIELYYEYDDFDKVYEAAVKLVSLDNESVIGHEYLGDVYLERSEYDKALSEYQTAQGIFGSYEYADVSIINCLIHLSELNEAKTLLDDMLKQTQPPAMAYVHRARIAMRESDETLAVEMLTSTFETYSYMTYVLDQFEEFEAIRDHERLVGFID
ncbi:MULTISPECIES: tetratricopeptide repeat protein [unclassified Fusibacter]|uniref:tetratricopeptide repeat protein n=1 Tax=unclassified Fusibacter TaxID=2624464 RepID=UPI001010BB56|nr:MULTISPECIES: tetratricopeptide repeat protein [unclassified Fusibacter]MCK8058380.1 tetratricopeptide repeat protein [Fusibacter sp. A2]NPE20963.1 tetratricopeptide repeat protein [Fusibacter sp. A1]RXV63165.1 tetratricopeptide repeat protein [Fusibacter sp. A1]